VVVSQLRYLTYLGTLSLAACTDPQGTDFALPEGDVDAGQALFVGYGCTGCHTISNMDLPQPEEQGPVRVILGGRVSRVRTYAELVTSIINPSHRVSARYLGADEVSRDGESLMVSYNDVMTVTELINLVTFLESRYEEFERPAVRYSPYPVSEDEGE
jgi:sulfur-oxidizing protein SoxX